MDSLTRRGFLGWTAAIAGTGLTTLCLPELAAGEIPVELHTFVLTEEPVTMRGSLLVIRDREVLRVTIREVKQFETPPYIEMPLDAVRRAMHSDVMCRASVLEHGNTMTRAQVIMTREHRPPAPTPKNDTFTVWIIEGKGSDPLPMWIKRSDVMKAVSS